MFHCNSTFEYHGAIRIVHDITEASVLTDWSSTIFGARADMRRLRDDLLHKHADYACLCNNASEACGDNIMSASGEYAKKLTGAPGPLAYAASFACMRRKEYIV